MFLTTVLLIVGLSVVNGKQNIQPECKPEMKTGCPKIFIPLCGSDNRTYANLCELCVKKFDNADNYREDILIQYEGECNNGDQPLNTKPDFEVKVNRPSELVVPLSSKSEVSVPLSKGDTVSIPRNSPTTLEIQNDQPVVGADDSSQVDCSQYQPRIGCNRMYFPICGSDGVSYNNECLLCLGREETGRDIFISRFGRCEDNTQQHTHDVTI